MVRCIGASRYSTDTVYAGQPHFTQPPKVGSFDGANAVV